MGGHAPGRWRFGAVEVDEHQRVVRVSGQPVPMDRSSLDVLLALLRHAGEVVTKHELLEAGWPARVVSENSLAKAISRLRHALGDDAEALKVVHGYGYRLAAAIVHEPLPVIGGVAATADIPDLQAGKPLRARPGWHMVRRAGVGATAEVWLARNAAGSERAIKFATGPDGLGSLRREIALAQYLGATPDAFPGVAPVLGWNLAEPPFFIELPWYADGSLGEWPGGPGTLAERPRAERLALCIALCEAVASLHEVGVIHRDLKPENIYPVGDAGSAQGPRIVLGDLGTSDASEPSRLAALGITMSLPATAGTGGAARYPGSLLYIAPEVIAGERPTLRSDVYALGVLVFQLVVGDLRRTLAPGWESEVGDALLCEDIALAAAASPANRAVDAGGLADRLRTLDARHAARAREQAREEAQRAAARQATRERGRRRLLLAVSGTFALGLAGTTMMYAAAEGARRDAVREAAQREAVLAFVTDDILGQADPYRNPHAAAGLPLIEAVERAAEGVGGKVSDPASAAAVHAMVAAVYFAHDRHVDAIEQYERARDIYRTLDDATADEVVAVETGLCDVHRIAGELAAAEDACLAAHARAGGAGAAREVATLKLGQLRGEQGRDEEALGLLRPLLAADAFAGEPQLRGELHWAMGLSERGLGRYAPARRHFEALLALQPGKGLPSTWTAWAYNSLGSVQATTGDYEAAEATLVEARRIFAATQGADQVEAQMPNIWRGEIRLRRGVWEEAAAFQQALLDAWRPTLQPGHPLWLKAQANLAWAQAEAGRTQAARAALDEALRKRATVFDRPGDEVAVRAMRWTRAALGLEDGAAADALLAIVDKALVREFPTAHPVRAEAECLHARRAIAGGRPRQARQRARACADMLANYFDARHPLAAEARALLAAAGPAQDVDATSQARE